MGIFRNSYRQLQSRENYDSDDREFQAHRIRFLFYFVLLLIGRIHEFNFYVVIHGVFSGFITIPGVGQIGRAQAGRSQIQDDSQASLECFACPNDLH